MKHLCAFYGLQDRGQTNVALAPVADIQLPSRGNTLVVPQDTQIQRAFLFGTNLIAARINVPSMRAITLPKIYPVVTANAIPNTPPYWEPKAYGPIALATEGIGIDTTTQGITGTTDATYGFLWLGGNLDSAPQGRAVTMQATNAVSLVTGSWVTYTPTLSDDLPAGRYAIVGAEAYGTGLYALRFRFPGQTMLPGILCNQAAGEFDDGSQRFGRLGSFGSFLNSALPTIDVLGAAGLQSINLFMDLVKLN